MDDQKGIISEKVAWHWHSRTNMPQQTFHRRTIYACFRLISSKQLSVFHKVRRCKRSPSRIFGVLHVAPLQIFKCYTNGALCLARTDIRRRDNLCSWRWSKIVSILLNDQTFRLYIPRSSCVRRRAATKYILVPVNAASSIKFSFNFFREGRKNLTKRVHVTERTT